MRTTDEKGNVKYVWEDSDIEDYYESKQTSAGKLHLLRLGAVLFVGLSAGCAIVFSAAKAYTYLFPQR